MNNDFLDLFSTGLCCGLVLGLIPFIIGVVIHAILSIIGGNTTQD